MILGHHIVMIQHYSCQCDHNCTFPADDHELADIFGGDPCVGVPKELKVNYECLNPPEEMLCPIPKNPPPNTIRNETNTKDHPCGYDKEPGAASIR